MELPINFGLMREAVYRQLPIRSDDVSRSRAEQLYKEGTIVSPRFGALRYDGGKIWADTAKRAQARFTHGFLFLSDWHGTLLRDPAVSRPAADFVVGLFRTWATDYADASSVPAVSHHDETTAQRLIQITAFLDTAGGVVSAEDLAWLTDLAVTTAELLATDDFHSTGNNHGMFQDLALLYFTVMNGATPQAERERYFRTATERLRTYFTSAFNADGVHRENTPTYHLMVCKHVHGVAEILSQVGHEHAGIYRELLDRAADYATHAIMPNGMYPPISDTTQQAEVHAARQNIFARDDFAYAASAGKLGTKPALRTLVLPESGYAIYRSAWGNPKATFAFFSAAYNANYHKHSDDLSLFLRSGGIDLLSEAGPYGYDYKDPLTKFGYSSYAHNCLVVDGVSLPRTDEGSHLTTLESHEVRDDGFRVTGRTARLQDTTHARELEVRETAGVTQIDVTDTIESGGEHTFELLWNLGPDVDPVAHGHGFELFHEGRKLMDLQFDADVAAQVSIHRGEKRPKYLGWKFPRFGEAIPSYVARVTFTGSRATLRSRIRLANFSYLDRGLHDRAANWRRSNGAPALNYLSVPATTTEGSGKLAVVFTAIHQPGDFTFNYKKSLDDTGVNALYILDDFGDQGAYYLGDHGDREIFGSTQALIRQELDRLGLKPADLITAGSSKGGSAALLHGIAAEAGRIIVGAPQVKIGSFLKTPHPNILDLIMGDTAEAAVKALDTVIFDAVESLSDATKVSIVVGEADHHYRNHVLPLKDHAEKHGKKLDITVLPGLPHAEIGGVYKAYLSAAIGEELGMDCQNAVGHVFLYSDRGPRSLHLKVAAPLGWELATRLFRGSEMIAKSPYGEDREIHWESLPPGRYRARVYLRNPESEESHPFTTDWLTVT